MNHEQKKNLKLPLFLIIGPIVILVLTVFLQTITEPEILRPTGDGYVDHMNSMTFSFNSLPIYERIARLLLSLISLTSLVAVVPCFIFGVMILVKRKSTGH